MVAFYPRVWDRIAWQATLSAEHVESIDRFSAAAGDCSAIAGRSVGGVGVAGKW